LLLLRSIVQAVANHSRSDDAVAALLQNSYITLCGILAPGSYLYQCPHWDFCTIWIIFSSLKWPNKIIVQLFKKLEYVVLLSFVSIKFLNLRSS